MPPSKALRIFEKATYYFDLAGEDPPVSAPMLPIVNGVVPHYEMRNLEDCIAAVGLDETYPETSMWLGAKALEAGDVDAARGEYHRTAGLGNDITALIDQYMAERQLAHRTLKNDSNMRMALRPLEQWIKTAQEVYGVHGKELSRNLAHLADCYLVLGEKQKALSAYKRLFELAEPADITANQVITYADLLFGTGHSGQAKAMLERKVINAEGQIDPDNPLLIRLALAYAEDKNSKEVDRLISKVASIPPPVKLPEGSLSVAPVPSSPHIGDVFNDPPAPVGLRTTQPMRKLQ